MFFLLYCYQAPDFNTLKPYFCFFLTIKTFSYDWNKKNFFHCSFWTHQMYKIYFSFEGIIYKNLDEYLFNWGIRIFIGSKWKTFICIKRFQMIFIKRYLSKMEIIKRFYWMNRRFLYKLLSWSIWITRYSDLGCCMEIRGTTKLRPYHHDVADVVLKPKNVSSGHFGTKTFSFEADF